jgi:hypothetical protein
MKSCVLGRNKQGRLEGERCRLCREGTKRYWQGWRRRSTIYVSRWCHHFRILLCSVACQSTSKHTTLDSNRHHHSLHHVASCCHQRTHVVRPVASSRQLSIPSNRIRPTFPFLACIGTSLPTMALRSEEQRKLDMARSMPSHRCREEADETARSDRTSFSSTNVVW